MYNFHESRTPSLWPQEQTTRNISTSLSSVRMFLTPKAAQANLTTLINGSLLKILKPITMGMRKFLPLIWVLTKSTTTISMPRRPESSQLPTTPCFSLFHQIFYWNFTQPICINFSSKMRTLSLLLSSSHWDLAQNKAKKSTKMKNMAGMSNFSLI